MTASTRRAAIGAILAAPLASVPAVAAITAKTEIVSDLAASCVWAEGHLRWINDPTQPLDDWPDERVDAELDRVDAVMDRAAKEPAASLPDLAAKARIVLASYEDHLRTSDIIADSALHTVLREVIALCA